MVLTKTDLMAVQMPSKNPESTASAAEIPKASWTSLPALLHVIPSSVHSPAWTSLSDEA